MVTLIVFLTDLLIVTVRRPDTTRETMVTLKNRYNECRVYDVWRSHHPASSVFTWLRPDGSVSSRIDLIGCPLT